ncbi:MAG: hypothetical protein J0H67_03465 [Rhodospirillales bacterium]|nr:hypothetical protein [Rhodospirillales bacterium]
MAAQHEHGLSSKRISQERAGARHRICAAVAGLLLGAVPLAAAAQSFGSESTAIPHSGFFGGIGAGTSFIQFGSQSVYNKGISNVYLNGALAAVGEADGPPVQPSLPSKTAVMPHVQVGYFHRLPDTDWFLGTKLSYNYVGAESSVSNLTIPQYGSSSAPGVTSFTGYSVTNAYKVSLQNQFLLVGFVGRQFGNLMVYGGGGASLSQKHAQLDSVVGYATINGHLVDISGAPQSVSNTSWSLGAAATGGVMYFFNPHLFLDANYVYSNTGSVNTRVQSPFNNPGNGTYATSGTLIGTYTSNLSSQMITVSLNWAF